MPEYAVYGITLATDFPFRWPLVRGKGLPDLRFECVADPPLEVRWGDVRPAHEVAMEGREDRPHVLYYRMDGFDAVRIPEASDHYVFPDRIVCHLHDPALAYLVEIQLLGMVLAVWLERRGIPTLHASAVAMGGEAVAFLGLPAGGKTTATAALLAQGHPLLVDDLLALDIGEDGVLARSGYPMLRLWPDQAAHFLGDHEHLPLVHPRYTKRRVLVGRDLGVFRKEPAPLRRIYLPTRTIGGDVSVEPVSSRDAVLELVRHSFLREAVHGLGLAGERLRALTRLLGTVDVTRLRYPSGFGRLPELVAAVEDDLARSPGGVERG